MDPVLAVIVAAIGLALACMGAGPVILSDRCWAVRRPRLAIALWLIAFLGGLTGYVLTIVVTIATAAVANASTGRGHWAGATVVVLAGWVALMSVGALAAVVSLGAEPIASAHRQTLRDVDLLAAATAYRRTMIGGHEVVYVPGSEPVALSVPRRRRIVVTSSIVDLLTPLELRSVIEHERAHLRGRHHRLMQLALVNAACLPGFFGARRFEESARLLIELAADDQAARICGAVATRDALARVGRARRDPSMALRASRIERRTPVVAAVPTTVTGQPEASAD